MYGSAEGGAIVSLDNAMLAQRGHIAMPTREVESKRGRYACVYCGTDHYSPNGTGSDVSCCGEVGQVEPLSQCDCCGEWAVTSRVDYHGIETIACLECQGVVL